MTDLPLRIGELGMPLDVAEQVLPLAGQVAGLVHEGDIQAVRQMVGPLTVHDTFGLLVALAALVDVDRPMTESLEWLASPRDLSEPAAGRRPRGQVVPPDQWEELTPRARDIATRRWLVNDMVNHGMPDRSIASKLGVSAATVARDRGYLGLPYGPVLAAHRQATGPPAAVAGGGCGEPCRAA